MNIEQLIATYYRAVDARDFDTLFALFSEDVVYERGGTGTIVGMRDFKRFYLEQRAIASGNHSIDAIVANDSAVAVRGRFEGILKDGSTIRVHFADFHEVAEGRIARRFTYFMGASV